MQERNIKIFWPAIGKKEDIIPKIEELFWPADKSRPFIGEGSLVDEFERKIMEKFDMDYVLYTNSGTAALMLALIGVGVKAGDEVITTAMTCTATNTPILERQAIPVFADVKYETGNIDPADIERRITDKTKAMMIVHWGGYPCDMDEINEIAKKHNLKVISDGAHSIGATYKGRAIAQTADYTMFSLQAIKQWNTVDGGLLGIKMKKSRKDLIKLSQDPEIRYLFRISLHT